jgi:hypothetical protein
MNTETDINPKLVKYWLNVGRVRVINQVLDPLRQSATPMTARDLRKVFLGRGESLNLVIDHLVANGDIVQTTNANGHKAYEVAAR